MKKILIFFTIMFMLTIASTSSAYEGFYDDVFGNPDPEYVNYSAAVPQKNDTVEKPCSKCLLIFAGMRNGQPFIDVAEDTITVFAGQPFYVTTCLAAKGQVDLNFGADFQRYFQEDTAISVRADRVYIAQKSGHTEMQITYKNVTKKIAINVVTWRNFSLINDQLNTTGFVGDVFFVKLPCDLKSGYDWYLSPTWNKETFEIVESGYTNPDNERPDKLKEHYWLIRAKVAGQGDMKFIYRRDKANDFALEDCSIKATITGY